MSTTDLPGSSLLAGRYRLVERLGAGGMSVVWRGFDEVLGRQVAVKVLPPSTSADPSFRRRLRAEAQAAARLSHPHITNVYDYGEATTADGEAVPYVVMELVDGESLAAVLARVRRLPWPAAVRICAEVSAALAGAHARGIVHRDVTPANVMLTSSGAKVVDFGISALIGENDIDPDGSLLGTPAYLAPERLEGGQVSPATDVYAVGLLIYRTLIGQLPWDVGTTTALLRAHQYTEPEPMPPVEGLPPAVSALIGRCLEKNPDDRPSSAELAHVLAGISAESPVRGLVPDWGENGEDTTILPSAHPYTGGLGRPRSSYAPAPAAGRGVAAVHADGPSSLSAAAAAMAAAHHDAPIDAPVSPAPGTAIPVPVADVEAAVAGERVAGRPIAAAMNPAADLSSLPSGPIAGPNAPALPDTPADNRGPGPAPGRNNRFAGTPRSQQVAAAPAAGPPASAGSAAGPPTSIRPAYTGSGRPADSLPSQRGGGSPPAPPPHGPGPSGPGGAGPSRPHRTQGRRVLFVAAAVALLGVAVYGWSLTATAAGSNDGRSPKSLPEPSIVAATGKCVVSYAVWSDTGDRFKATVTVANRDNAPIKNWNLWFIMQGDQTVSGNGKVQLTQQGTAVTVKSPGTLNPQNAVTLDVTGRYDASNQPPMVFELDNKTCETYVSGKPGEPSRPVQKLANGKGYTFGPPAKDNPAPGIIIGPGGVVTPGPLPTTTGAAGTTTPPTTGTTTTTTTTTTPTATATTTTTTNAGGGGNNGPGPGPGCQSNCPTADPTTTDPTTEPTDSTVTTPPGEPDPGTDDTDTDPADE